MGLFGPHVSAHICVFDSDYGPLSNTLHLGKLTALQDAMANIPSADIHVFQCADMSGTRGADSRICSEALSNGSENAFPFPGLPRVEFYRTDAKGHVVGRGNFEGDFASKSVGDILHQLRDFMFPKHHTPLTEPPLWVRARDYTSHYFSKLLRPTPWG